MDAFKDGYIEIGYGVGGLVFISSWVYCTVAYGFLFGFGLGWIPSLILCFIAVGLWPLFIALLIVFWTPVALFLVGLIEVIKPLFH